ncbi:Hypothetical predicted protein [Pelobates cultripes]|uniref:Uncharacterized protein n=1 Tax=Pelobates cultripes TaxID=61616 RepID=A0AAD1S1P4_PELCU|nr:Hypothetical predicted protein [Pelobates cultripes]
MHVLPHWSTCTPTLSVFPETGSKAPSLAPLVAWTVGPTPIPRPVSAVHTLPNCVDGPVSPDHDSNSDFKHPSKFPECGAGVDSPSEPPAPDGRGGAILPTASTGSRVSMGH